MSRERSPAFQWFPRDVQSDYRYKALSPAERGAYRDLLDYIWMEGELPADDDTILSGLVNMQESEWGRVKDRVLSLFLISKTGTIRHKRLDLERRRQKKFRETRMSSGLLGSKTRWQNKRHDNGLNNTAIGNPLHRGIGRDSSSSSSSPSGEGRGEDVGTLVVKQAREVERGSGGKPTARLSRKRAREETTPNPEKETPGESELGAASPTTTPRTRPRTHVLWLDQRQNLMRRYVEPDPTGIVEAEDQAYFHKLSDMLFAGLSDKVVVEHLMNWRQYDLGQVVWAAADYLHVEKHLRPNHGLYLFRRCIECDDGGFQKRLQQEEIKREKILTRERRRERRETASSDPVRPGNGRGFEQIGEALVRALPALQRASDHEIDLCAGGSNPGREDISKPD